MAPIRAAGTLRDVHAPTLTLDLRGADGPEVRVGTLTWSGQWVEFYGLLALSRSDPVRVDEYLSPERLHSMAKWSHGKKLASVGKEVARHCKKELEQQGLSALLDYKYRTKFWRLAIPADAIRMLPSREAVERWLSSQTLTVPSGGEWLEQLEVLVAAQLAITTGEGARACEDLRRLRSFALPEFEAWAALLDARATDQHVDEADNASALDELGDYWAHRSDIAGRSVAARIQARNALRKRHLGAEEQYAGLGKVAADLEQRGDVSALASVTNVLGVLATRLGRPKQASQHHLRAAALFGIVDDPNSLQAALFNLANSYVKERRVEYRRPDRRALRILDIGLEFAQRYTVGRDTLQSEIAGCHWCVDLGDYEQARRYLAAAECLVTHLDSAFEQGCFLLARARLEIVAPTGVHDILRDLRIARRAFEAAGDQSTLLQIDALIKLVETHRAKPS